MNYSQIDNIYTEFTVISHELLNSNENTFKANASYFKEFCISTKLIYDILKPISEVDFNGINYFNNKSNPSNRFTKFPIPQNRLENLKASYDVLLDDNLKSSYIWNYAIWALHPSTEKIDELIRIGTKEIFGKLINYIDLELTKLINIYKEKNNSNPSQLNFHIQNANGSIIGNQENATVNNSYSLDEIKQLINEKIENNDEKEELQQLINSLKAITENNIPIQRGTFSKFSEALEKHSWVTGAISQTLISWLTGM